MKLKHLFIVLALLISGSVFSQNQFTLSGIVSDSVSGETLKGIDIFVKDRLTGTISNYRGAYLLYLNEGEYEISFSGNGYVKEVISIQLHDDLSQSVALKPAKSKSQKRLFSNKRSEQEKLISANENKK